MLLFSLSLFNLIHYKLYTSNAQLPKEWDDFAPQDIFLQTTYLKAFENSAPKTISLYYIGVFDDDVLTGLAIIQRVKLYAKDMFRSESPSRWKAILKNGLSSILKGNILVVGNLTHTGQHGIYFNPEMISQDIFLDTIFEAINDLKSIIKRNQGKSIRAILFKDYFKDDPIHDSFNIFKKHDLYHVNVQPNMLLPIRSQWYSMEDYLNNLNTKYKTRFKRAKRKLGSITSKELTEDEISRHAVHLYNLYKNVSNNATFNTFVLPEHHFITLKVQLKNNFRVFGYYLKDELIGFYTLILNNDTVETYFLGYSETHQYEHQLYLNMLYEMLHFGITNRFRTIVYARTAMEIKSSVGAKSKSMSMYIKHTNGFLNILLKPIFKLMHPERIWEERHPFKD